MGGCSGKIRARSSYSAVKLWRHCPLCFTGEAGAAGFFSVQCVECVEHIPLRAVKQGVADGAKHRAALALRLRLRCSRAWGGCPVDGWRRPLAIVSGLCGDNSFGRGDTTMWAYTCNRGHVQLRFQRRGKEESDNTVYGDGGGGGGGRKVKRGNRNEVVEMVEENGGENDF